MPAPPPGRPVRLELVGVSDRSRQTFEMVFARMGKGHGVIVNSTVAEAAIIDLDGARGDKSWQDYRARFPERELVLISAAEQYPKPGIEFLQKPVNISRLLRALDGMRRRLDESSGFAQPARGAFTVMTGRDGTRTLARTSGETLIVRTASHKAVARPEPDPREKTEPLAADTASAGAATPSRTAKGPIAPSTEEPSDLVGDQEDIDIDDPQSVAALQLATDGYLLDITRKARDQAQSGVTAMHVQLPGGGLILDPANGRAVWRNDMDLRGLCDRPLPADAVELVPIGARVVDDIAAGGDDRTVCEDIQALLWRLALWTYRGRLPAGTRLKERAYLAHWPNLTRLSEIPNAMRISALWSARAMPLPHMAEALKIPQRHVFAFYGAANAIGIAGRARREADSLFQPIPAVEHQQRSVLSRMIGKLRGLVGT